MKRTIVVFGVLVAFLLALTEAYALENNTWGRVKATFSEGPSMASDHAQLVSEEEEFSSDYWYREHTYNVNRDSWMQANATRLDMPAGGLEKNTKLWMKITKKTPSALSGAISRTYDFGPHGTVFLKPLKLRLYFGDADLSGVSEKDLQIYYYNEETGQWEWMGGIVDTKAKEVVFHLLHFSRYALARCP